MDENRKLLGLDCEEEMRNRVRNHLEKRKRN